MRISEGGEGAWEHNGTVHGGAAVACDELRGFDALPLVGVPFRRHVAWMFAPSPEKWTPAGFVWGFIIIGGLICAAGLIWIAHTAWFLARSTETTGVVVAVTAIDSTANPGDDPRDKQVTSYYPVVEYHSAAGGTHRTQSTRAAQSNHFNTGDTVGVYHHPTKPQQALLRDPWMLWFSPGIIVAGGLLWLLFAGGALMLVKKFDVDLDRNREHFLRRVSAEAERKS